MVSCGFRVGTRQTCTCGLKRSVGLDWYVWLNVYNVLGGSGFITGLRVLSVRKPALRYPVS